jgi:hypothetical protein
MRLGLFATWPCQINPNRRKAWNVSRRLGRFVPRSLIFLAMPGALWPGSLLGAFACVIKRLLA